MKKGFLTKKKTNKKSRSMPHLRTGGGNNGRRRPFATGRSKHNNNGMNYNSNSNNNVKYLSSPSKRFSILMKKFVLPKACRTNTESFRSEISQDDVQVVYKRHSNNLRKLFSYYAAQSAKAEKKAMKDYGSSDSGATLGDILGVALNAENNKK